MLYKATNKTQKLRWHLLHLFQKKALQSSGKLPYFFVWVNLKIYLIVKASLEDCHQVQQSYATLLGWLCIRTLRNISLKLKPNLLYEEDKHTFSPSGKLVVPDRASSCVDLIYKKNHYFCFIIFFLFFSFSL